MSYSYGTLTTYCHTQSFSKQCHCSDSITASEISPNDPIGVIFGKEHPGRVRGLSYGACPTLAFQQSTTRIRGINFASPDAASPHDKDKFVKIENELATVKNQVQALLAYIASKEDVPEHVAAMAA